MVNFRLRPSAAASWIVCHAAPRMRAMYPNDSGDAAEEGSAAHWVNAEIAYGRRPALGSLAPNGVVIDKDMLKYGDEYIDILRTWDTPPVIEQKIKIPYIADDLDGTPDAWTANRQRRIIRCMDYKYGFGLVEPFENWQLLCYVSGIVSVLGLANLIDDDWTVEFTVFQPRAHHYEGTLRTWTTRLATLGGYFNQLKFAAIAAKKPDAAMTTGEQCRYCEARHACPALQASAYIAVQMSQVGNSFDLDVNQAGRELIQMQKAIAVLKARATGLESQIEHDILRGNKSVHFSLERAKTREKWKLGTEAQVIAMGQILGKDLAEPPTAISPAQCRKLLIDESVISAYSMKPDGELKLVPLETTTTRKLFGV